MVCGLSPFQLWVPTIALGLGLGRAAYDRFAPREQPLPIPPWWSDDADRPSPDVPDWVLS